MHLQHLHTAPASGCLPPMVVSGSGLHEQRGQTGRKPHSGQAIACRIACSSPGESLCVKDAALQH